MPDGIFINLFKDGNLFVSFNPAIEETVHFTYISYILDLTEILHPELATIWLSAQDLH